MTTSDPVVDRARWVSLFFSVMDPVLPVVDEGDSRDPGWDAAADTATSTGADGL